ncbi:MAG TPA: hypothetical protein VMV29_01110 [Ktedonobacterales bacterium]|nr:hypothetical protein [Ktedonobacterales bacterium]
MWQQTIKWLAPVIAAIMLVGASIVGGGGAAVQASAATRAVTTMPAYGTPHETSKLTLPEASIDGPALWTQRGPSAPVGPLAVLAWTGTDTRLNFEFTNDGKTFMGKQTLNETSFVRPAVLRGTGSGAVVAPVALAWVGDDAGHHLNVLYTVPGSSPMKLTLWQDNSFTSPALEWLDGGAAATLLLAWAGTDTNHSLNVLPISIKGTGLVAGTKTTLWSYHSADQPALIHDNSMTSQTRLFLSWSDVTSHRIAWATSSDGKAWTQQTTFTETSGAAPSMMGLVEQLAHVPPYWLGWTGTDGAHHVNVLYTLDFTQWTTNFVKATLPETAVGGTEIGFFLGMAGDLVLVAWTGTDAGRHLNLAIVAI